MQSIARPVCLITGGAGYIGSHTARWMLEAGYKVVVLDNLFRGHREAVAPGACLEVGDTRDRSFVDEVFGRHRPDCVIHFAALAYVGESFEKNGEYFDVNVGGTTNILKAMNEYSCRQIVFSSSCTVYGIPESNEPLDETAPIQSALSPYGESKIMVERMLQWQSETSGMRVVCLRYFNAAGASAEYGEDHKPETHLIPLAIDACVAGEPVLNVMGSDYETRDGTCIRDYVHVEDLASAHLLATEKLRRSESLPFAINLGTGEGNSVIDVIGAVEKATGKKLPHRFAPRRPGDAPCLVASCELARVSLGWEPAFPDLDSIVVSAFNWRKKFPGGY